MFGAATLTGAPTFDVASGASLAFNSTINNGANSVTVQGAGNTTISGILGSGSGGLTKAGTGTLTLAAANSYTGATAVQNGTVVISGGNDRLPTGTTVTLGAGSTSGLLQLGDSGGARNQALAGLVTFGSGTANAVVGGNASTSTLTINNGSGLVYGGLIGGVGANQNNLALTKSGAGNAHPDCGQHLRRGNGHSKRDRGDLGWR